MSATVLASVFNGGRVSRHSEFIIITLRGSSFATTPAEFERHQDWARTRASTGDAARDCAMFLARFDTVIGRDGSGIPSKGSAMAVLRIIKAMRANAVFMEGWNVPYVVAPT
ncbi:MAG: hypothetical protein ACT4PK_05885 [Gammaproteobacteria bacterium]